MFSFHLWHCGLIMDFKMQPKATKWSTFFLFYISFFYACYQSVCLCNPHDWGSFVRLRLSKILALFLLMCPWKCIKAIPCKASLKTLLLGRQTELHNGIVIHASQCFSNVTVIMKNILTFPLHTRSRANLISKAKRRRNTLNNHCV